MTIQSNSNSLQFNSLMLYGYIALNKFRSKQACIHVLCNCSMKHSSVNHQSKLLLNIELFGFFDRVQMCVFFVNFIGIILLLATFYPKLKEKPHSITNSGKMNDIGRVKTTLVSLAHTFTRSPVGFLVGRFSSRKITSA